MSFSVLAWPVNISSLLGRARYAKILGSAVNPVLREGNSDRRCAGPVKEMARKQSRRSPAMRAWAGDNVSHVASMTHGDFYGSEQSVIMPGEETVSILFRWGEGEGGVMVVMIYIQVRPGDRDCPEDWAEAAGRGGGGLLLYECPGSQRVLRCSDLGL